MTFPVNHSMMVHGGMRHCGIPKWCCSQRKMRCCSPHPCYELAQKESEVAYRRWSEVSQRCSTDRCSFSSHTFSGFSLFGPGSGRGVLGWQHTCKGGKMMGLATPVLSRCLAIFCRSGTLRKTKCLGAVSW